MSVLQLMKVNEMEQKYQKLVKNTALFAIGSLASKILTFLIVPLYTYVLSTEEYGKIDLFTTTISFAIPILSLQIHEAMIRFLLGKEMDERTVVGNCWVVFLAGSFFSTLLFPLYLFIFKKLLLSLIFWLLLILENFNGIFIHYLRTTGKTSAYAIKGVLCTVVFLSFNVLFLVVFKLGMMGYFYSFLISNVVGVLFLLIFGGLVRAINIKEFDFPSLKKMLFYSIPLIPNSLMWWIMSAGDKYIINLFLGDSANGIYSLSLKIPTIVSLFYTFFAQAWQMSAIEENNSAERKKFYETIYKTSNALLLLVVTLITVFVKPVFKVMSENFYSSWKYVPLLSFAMALSCQASFFGVVYTTSKNTKRAFFTTALGAVMNLTFNLILINIFDLHGIVLGTLIGYFVVMVIRAKDTKTEIGMSFDLHRTVLGCLVVLIQILLTILIDNWIIYLFGVVSIVVVWLLYLHECASIFSTMLKRFKRKKKHE